MFGGGEQLPRGPVREIAQSCEARTLHNKEETAVSFQSDRRKRRVQKAVVIKMWFRSSAVRTGLAFLEHFCDFKSCMKCQECFTD